VKRDGKEVELRSPCTPVRALAGPADRGPFAEGARYNSYGSFLRERFGCRVYKVIVDAGLTCPNRDGTIAVGGCTYCSNDSFRPAFVPRLKPVFQQVAEGIDYLRGRFRAEKFVVYFQPFSNTYAPLQQLAPLYEAALEHPDVIGLSVGTRPDCVSAEKLEWFGQLARERFVTIEYGLESVHDETLRRINRGHDARCWRDAVAATAGRGIHVGTHVILGFPWESRNQMFETAQAVSEAKVDFLKLHHLHVVRGTALAHEFQSRPFRLLEFREYLDLAADFLERLNPRIRMERLFGLAPSDRLLGPKWGRSKAQIQFALVQTLTARSTWQGRLYRAVD
jgi:uncharacterized protein